MRLGGTWHLVGHLQAPQCSQGRAPQSVAPPGLSNETYSRDKRLLFMITKKQHKFKRSKCTQTQAYDVELIFRKIWALVSYFSEVV